MIPTLVLQSLLEIHFPGLLSSSFLFPVAVSKAVTISLKNGTSYFIICVPYGFAAFLSSFVWKLLQRIIVTMFTNCCPMCHIHIYELGRQWRIYVFFSNLLLLYDQRNLIAFFQKTPVLTAMSFESSSTSYTIYALIYCFIFKIAFLWEEMSHFHSPISQHHVEP